VAGADRKAGPRFYPPELRARAVRLYRESDPKPTIRTVAEQLGIHPETLRTWVRQSEADHGERIDRPTTDMLEENRRLRQEVAELRRANEILKAASLYFAQELDPTRRRS
jgi:transposase